MDDLVSIEINTLCLLRPGIVGWKTYMYLVLSWSEPPPEKSVKFRFVDTRPWYVLKRSVDFQGP